MSCGPSPKFLPMTNIINRTLLLLVVFFAAFSGFAAAQERGVPLSRPQIQLSFAPLVKIVAPSVVNIYTKRTVSRTVPSPFMSDPFFAPFFNEGLFGGRMRRQVESALGSGVIVAADGLVVTNAHVVKDAEEITVVLADGREFDAALALVDEPSDLALLRLEKDEESFPFISLKPSESLQVGDLVLAIGNPFGVGQTVTSGIVSALARSSLDVNDFNFFIQTDAAINPGNSGGPLVALDGGVVGINTAIYSRDGGSLGLGFAIPSEMVASVIAAEKGGAVGARGVARPWMGAEAQKVSPDIAASLNLERPMGALINKLHTASPLKAAGIEVGDVILSINGKTVHDPAEVKFRMATVPISDKAELEVFRNGQVRIYKVTALPPPDKPPRKATLVTGENPLAEATIARINPAVSFELNLPADLEKGIVVLASPRGSRAGRLVTPGDIILEINGKKIETIKEALSALQQPSPRGWEFLLSSRGQTKRILLR